MVADGSTGRGKTRGAEAAQPPVTCGNWLTPPRAGVTLQRSSPGDPGIRRVLEGSLVARPAKKAAPKKPAKPAPAKKAETKPEPKLP